MSEPFLLSGKYVVITGGAGGLGRAMAKEFSCHGATVELVDRNSKALQRAQRELEDAGCTVTVSTLDVTRISDFTRFKNRIKKSGRTVHVWVNNAGVAHPGNFENHSDADAEHLLEVNLMGVVRGTRTALEIMGSRGGTLIVNMASAAGHIPSPFLATYAASKHGIVGLTRSLALECRWRGLPVRFCLVSPGFAETAIMKTDPRLRPPSFLISSPGSVAKQIVIGILRGDEEISPARIGALSVSSYRIWPRAFTSLSRLLFSKTMREFIGWDAIQR